MLEAAGDVYRLNEHIAIRHCSEPSKHWAFNTIDGDHYSLNATSFWLLNTFDGHRALKGIFMDFLETYDVGEDQGRQDFDEIVTNFINEGLIVKGEEA